MQPSLRQMLLDCWTKNMFCDAGLQSMAYTLLMSAFQDPRIKKLDTAESYVNPDDTNKNRYLTFKSKIIQTTRLSGIFMYGSTTVDILVREIEELLYSGCKIVAGTMRLRLDTHIAQEYNGATEIPVDMYKCTLMWVECEQ